MSNSPLTEQQYEAEYEALQEEEFIAEIEREEAKRHVKTNLRAFTKEFWRQIVPVPFQDTWVIGAMCEHLQALWRGEIIRLLINIYGRSGKSTIASVMYPAWVWAQEPSERFIYVASTQGLALRDADFTRDVINSEAYRKMFGGFSLTKDSSGLYRNDKLGSRQSLSIDSKVTGFGANNKFLDDPNDANDVDSVVKREDAISRFGNLSTRSDSFDTDRFCVSQQRVHPMDVTGYIDKIGLEFTRLIIPLEYKGKEYVSVLGTKDPRTTIGEIADPVRFPPRAVQELKATLGYRYEGQANQDPKLQEGGAIKRAWYKECEFIDFSQVKAASLSYDIGYSSSPNADWTWGSWKARMKDDTFVTFWQHFGKWDNEERNRNMKEFGLTVQSITMALMPNVPWNLDLEGGVGPGYELNKKCRDVLIAAGLPARLVPTQENKVVRANVYLTATEAGKTFFYSGEQFKDYELSKGTAAWQRKFLDITSCLMFDNAADGTPRWKNEHDDPLDAEAAAHNALIGDFNNIDTGIDYSVT
ncbi:hypothetical protein KGP36_07775 [Patescibacteria group bacterium]|nr:hypothetical protein [Patescibacteria group bacterium]